MKDNFSKQSAQYQKFRPSYPKELIRYLSDQTDRKEIAWDCGTGNGQAAVILAEIFKQVIATDISANQIAKAPKKDNIIYKLEQAENSSIESHSVDLLLVAQAAHWFDFDKFYNEVRRVVKTGGIIAIIGYPLLTTENHDLNQLIWYLYKDIVGKYWDDERKHIDERYETIPFPFEQFDIPEFNMKYKWDLKQLTGYLSSWSAVQHYIKANHTDPIDRISEDMRKLVGKDLSIEVTFEIIGKYGHV